MNPELENPSANPANPANRDPITQEPGAHPVGTGLGAAGGAAAGVTLGAVGGPLGMALGGIVGAVAGGLAGKATAEAVNPTEEEAYWRESFQTDAFVPPGSDYAHYRDAYHLGWEASQRYLDDDFNAIQMQLADEWRRREEAVGTLPWALVQPAVRAAWTHARMSGVRAAPGRSAAAVSPAAVNTPAHQPDLIDALNDLAMTARDGQKASAAAVTHARSQAVKQWFARLAEHHGAVAIEIQQMVDQLGGTPTTHGSVGGAFSRGWTALQATVASDEDAALLDAWATQQDVTIARIKEALQARLPEAVRDALERWQAAENRQLGETRAMRAALPTG